VPFTFSHPAIVLPLTVRDKNTFSTTALVIGSITPDFEYFANFAHHSIYSHTWIGVLWFDLPVSIIIFYVYNKIVKDELIDNLPTFLNKRFVRMKTARTVNYSTRRYRVIFISLLLGIISHLFWDRLLHKSVTDIEDPADYYSIFWDGNSIIGAIVIALMVYKLPKADVVKRNTYFFWCMTLLITLFVVVVRSMYSTDIRNLQVSVISGFLIGLLITCSVQKQRKSMSRRNAADPVSKVRG
jgi:hypothetical protein